MAEPMTSSLVIDFYLNGRCIDPFPQPVVASTVPAPGIFSSQLVSGAPNAHGRGSSLHGRLEGQGTSLLKGDANRDPITWLEGPGQADQHDVVAAGLQLEAPSRGDVELLDHLHRGRAPGAGGLVERGGAGSRGHRRHEGVVGGGLIADSEIDGT